MITRFGSLFAGHVDLDDHGLAATPVNDRWLPNERLVKDFDKATAIARLLDRTGMSSPRRVRTRRFPASPAALRPRLSAEMPVTSRASKRNLSKSAVAVLKSIGTVILVALKPSISSAPTLSRAR